jgi:flavorubredoxin
MNLFCRKADDHWPDSMMTYVREQIQCFQMTLSGSIILRRGCLNESDTCEVYQEAIKYYANILTPFSALIKKKIEEIKAMNLKIDMMHLATELSEGQSTCRLSTSIMSGRRI